jgi:hypothetical protein
MPDRAVEADTGKFSPTSAIHENSPAMAAGGPRRRLFDRDDNFASRLVLSPSSLTPGFSTGPRAALISGKYFWQPQPNQAFETQQLPGDNDFSASFGLLETAAPQSSRPVRQRPLAEVSQEGT